MRMTAHARTGRVVARPRYRLVLVLVGGVLIVLGAKAGTVSGPEPPAPAAIDELPDVLFWAPDERPAEAS